MSVHKNGKTKIQIAEETPFEPGRNPDYNGELSPLTAEDVQSAIEEVRKIATDSPGNGIGFAWGRRGRNHKWQWLRNNDVLSNKTGIPFRLPNGVLTNIWVGNKDITTFDVTIYHHLGDEVALTPLITVSIVSSRIDTFDVSDFGIVNIPQNVQLAARITDTSGQKPKEVEVFLTIEGI